MSDRFNKWAAAVKLSLKIEPELPKDNLFRSLSHIVQSSKQFPSWLSQEESGQLSYLTHRFGDWVPRLCKDVQRLGVTIQPRLDPYDSMQSGNRACRATNDDQAGNDLQQTLDPNSGALDGIVYGNGNLASGQNGRSALVLVEDPDPDLASAMSAILGLVKQSDGLIDRLTWDANEAELRSGIDHLLTLCYDESDSMTLRLERELQLPDIKDPALNIPSTKPGTCIFLEFRSIWSYRNADATLRSHYSCLFQKTPSRTLNVVHSLVEYGSGAPGQNQAFMGLVSGLYQRRFLGIKDQFVFATMQTGLSNLQVVAAIWKDDTIKVYNLGEYTTLAAVQMVEFYLLHRAISRLGGQYHEQISQEGSRDHRFPETIHGGLVSWAPYASSSTTPPTSAIEQVSEGEESQAQEDGLSESQGLGNSLKELGQLGDDEKMNMYFSFLDSQVRQ